MYTKHNYFNDENPLILGRYFVYQNAPAGGPASGPKQEEAQESAPETEATPEKPITFEEVKKEFDNLKREYEKIKKDLPKDHPFHKKMEELGKKIDDAAKSKEDISKETLQAIEDLKKETPEQTAKRIMGVMREMDRRIDFLEARKNVEPEFEDLSKKIKNIQDELAQILKKRLDQTPAGVKKINELMLAYKKAMDRVGVIWNAPPSKPKPKPKGEPKPEEEPRPKGEPKPEEEPKPKGEKKPEEEPKPKGEKKEVASTGPKEKLVFMLGKVLEEGREAFDQNKNEITKLLTELIESLDIKPGAGIQVSSIDLPEGFTLGYVNWPEKASKNSNFAIFKDGETVCYMQNNGGAQPKMELTHARELGQNERPDFGRRVAELIKGNLMLSKVLSQIKELPTSKNIIFANPMVLNDFKSSLVTMAKMSQTDKPGWELNYGGKIVQFERKGPIDGLFKIEINGRMMYFDTKKPNIIGLEQPAVKGGKEISYRDAGTFILSPADQVIYDREESIRRERDVVDTTKQEHQEQQASQAEPGSPGPQEQPEKAPEVSDANKFLHEEYKSLVAESGKDFIKIIDEKDDKEGLVNRVRIDELLNLDLFGNQAVTVEIEGPSGKRTGRYWPGDATFFEFKDGKLTNNRIKFYNGDKISFNFQPLPEGQTEETEKNDTEEEKEAKRLEQEADEWQEKAKKLYAEVFDDEAAIGELNTKDGEGQDLTPQEKSKLEKLKAEFPAKDNVASEANQKALELRAQADAIRRGQGKDKMPAAARPAPAPAPKPTPKPKVAVARPAPKPGQSVKSELAPAPAPKATPEPAPAVPQAAPAQKKVEIQKVEVGKLKQQATEAEKTAEGLRAQAKAILIEIGKLSNTILASNQNNANFSKYQEALVGLKAEYKAKDTAAKEAESKAKNLREKANKAGAGQKS